MFTLTPSSVILNYMLPFAVLFSRPVWKNALILVLGAILTRSKRTVTACLRVVGLKDEINFPKYHWVLSHAKWSSLMASRILLGLIVSFVGAHQPLFLVIDETLERRKGKKIKAKGYYRDAVRSSEKTIVKCLGLKWLTLTVLVQFPWSKRRWALPCMTVLQPSERSNKAAKKKHKTSIDWSIQVIKQVRKWFPKMAMTILGDGGFAAAAFCWTCLRLNIDLVSRLRIDTRLYDFPPERIPKTPGRPAIKGQRLISFKEMLTVEGLPWKEVEINGYGEKRYSVRYLTSTALWHVEGYMPIPVRWVLVVDPTGKKDPVPLFSTNVSLSAERIIELFIERWSIEVTFEEVRAHLGVETQRQWSDGAIARTTPALMGLFSLLCLIAAALLKGKEIEKGEAAWYQKSSGTFSDVLTTVRKELWKNLYFNGVSENSMRRENQNHKWFDWLIDILGSAA